MELERVRREVDINHVPSKFVIEEAKYQVGMHITSQMPLWTMVRTTPLQYCLPFFVAPFMFKQFYEDPWNRRLFYLNVMIPYCWYNFYDQRDKLTYGIYADDCVEDHMKQRSSSPLPSPPPFSLFPSSSFS